METLQEEQDECQIARSWGWAAPPACVLEYARASLLYRKLRAGDAAVAMGLISEADKEAVLSDKPGDRRTLEWLALSRPAIKTRIDKLLALRAGYQYIDDPAAIGLAVHPVMTTGAVHRKCDSAGCIAMLIEQTVPLLCFGAWTDLLRYRQEGRSVQNPILSAFDGRNPLLALVEPSRVAGLRAAIGAGIVQEPMQGNLWIAAHTLDSKALAAMSDWLDAALASGATDVDLEPLRDGRGRIRFRMDGHLTDPPAGPQFVSSESLVEISRFLAQRSGANPTAARIRDPADGQIVYRSSVGEAFIRLSFIPLDPAGASFEMLSVELRLLPRKEGAIGVERLNLPDDVIHSCRSVMTRSQGLVVLSGPTNSGKSTTVAALLEMHRLLHGDSRKRIGIEDPVERYLEGVRQVSLTRNVDDGFARYFKAALRHDPDLAMIGEIRDEETAGIAVRAATSGHAVLTTVHANDAVLAYRAIANMIPRERHFDLVESLALIVGQRLARRICRRCGGTWRDIDERERDELARYFESQSLEPPILDRVPTKGAGCSHCRNTGFDGLLPIHEFIEVGRSLKSVMHGGNYDYTDLARHRPYTLAESAMTRVVAGQILLESAFI